MNWSSGPVPEASLLIVALARSRGLAHGIWHGGNTAAIRPQTLD